MRPTSLQLHGSTCSGLHVNLIMAPALEQTELRAQKNVKTIHPYDMVTVTQVSLNRTDTDSPDTLILLTYMYIPVTVKCSRYNHTSI